MTAPRQRRRVRAARSRTRAPPGSARSGDVNHRAVAAKRFASLLARRRHTPRRHGVTNHIYDRDPRAGSGFSTVSTRELSDIDAFFAPSDEPAFQPHRRKVARARRRIWSGPADEASVDESRPPLTADDARWAAPVDSPDHGHLLPQVFSARYFTLTEGTLERLLACNRFQILSSPSPILFALRGCTLAGELSTPWSTSANLTEALPDRGPRQRSEERDRRRALPGRLGAGAPNSGRSGVPSHRYVGLRQRRRQRSSIPDARHEQVLVAIGDESATLIKPDADVELWVGAADGVKSGSGDPKIGLPE